MFKEKKPTKDPLLIQLGNKANNLFAHVEPLILKGYFAKMYEGYLLSEKANELDDRLDAKWIKDYLDDFLEESATVLDD